MGEILNSNSDYAVMEGKISRQFIESSNHQSKMPFVTVLMAVFNAEKWLSDSIKSVLAQTFEDYELLIVDDGSSDDSIRVAQSFASIDSRIRFFQLLENVGQVQALNFGLYQARGEWIARFDADDLCSPHRLERQVEFVKSQNGKEVVLLGSGCSLIDEDGNLLGDYHYPVGHKSLLKLLFRTRSCFPHSSAFFNRNIAVQSSGYQTFFRRSQDIDLWLRFAEKGQISCLPHKLVFVRVHEGQLSSQDSGTSQIIYSFVALISYVLRDQNRGYVQTDGELKSLYNVVSNSREVRILNRLATKKASLRLKVQNMRGKSLVSRINRSLRFFSFVCVIVLERLFSRISVETLRLSWNRIL